MKLMRVLSLAAVGACLVVAAPAQRAQALSLINPGDAAAVHEGSRPATTEVRWHRWHHRHWRRPWHRRWHHRRWR
jgi:hypothetical protein